MKRVGGILSQDDFNGGLNTISDPFSLQASESPRVQNVNFNDDASLECRLGRNKLNNTVTGHSDYCNGLFDFGVGVGTRKLIGHYGTTVYKMDDLDGTWDSLLTSRNDCLNYFDRINGYLVNSTESREVLKYWNGTDATMADLNTDAPLAKYIGEFNGYMFAMNIKDNARRVYYELTGSMFTGDWEDYFTLPSSSDDEITWAVELRSRYYISLKNMWYRISFVSGEAVFDYKPVLSATIGAVPRTAKIVTIPNGGEVIMYLGWDKKIWIFNGTDAQSISLRYEKNNNESTIFLDNINQTQLRYAHAKVDTASSTYHLFIPNGATGMMNVRLDINYKTMACSPHTSQEFLSAVIAEDTSGKKYLIGGDYNGTAYILNRGTIDEVALNNVEIGTDGSLTSIEGAVVAGGGVVSNKVHDAGDNKTTYAEDSGENFDTLGVAVGDLVRNKEDQCQGIVTSIDNGGGTNARLTCSGGFSGGTGNDFDDDDLFNVYKAVFLSDNDSMYIGSKVKFDTIVIDLQQFASGTIIPTISYSSDAAGAYTALTVSSDNLSDGTTGFTKSGVIIFTPPSGWTATAKDDGANNFNDTTTYYYIKIQRTANTLTTTPKLNKVNIGLRIDDVYVSPKFTGKKLSDIKKPSTFDFYFEPIGNYNVRFYDRVDYQRSWSEGSKRPVSIVQNNVTDAYLGTFVLGTSTLGSAKTLVKYSVNAQGINNCYQYYITSNKSYGKRWKLFKVDFSGSPLGTGDSRPITRV